MEELIKNMIQGSIGYTFNNLDLLNQAFTRRSYTEENGGENNEVLEFIGDKALDFAIIKILIAKFGKIKNGNTVEGTKSSNLAQFIYNPAAPHVSDCINEFSCSYSEGELTKIKSRMVQKKNLAKRIDEMGFAEYLILGKGDIKNEVLNEMSVKEDLFEALIGAVALDSGWDFEKICSVVEAMILPEDFLETDQDDNYVRIIQDWNEEVNGVIPWFWFEEKSYTSTWFMKERNVIYQKFPLEYNHSRLKYSCKLHILDGFTDFCGFGASKSEARMNVCKLAYEWLCENGYIKEITIRDEIDNPNINDAINQLEILARRGYFSVPTYDFEQKYDVNGNPIWYCQCNIAEYNRRFKSRSSAKKDAKKKAAYKTLRYVLNEEKKP